MESSPEGGVFPLERASFDLCVPDGYTCSGIAAARKLLARVPDRRQLHRRQVHRRQVHRRQVHRRHRRHRRQPTDAKLLNDAIDLRRNPQLMARLPNATTSQQGLVRELHDAAAKRCVELESLLTPLEREAHWNWKRRVELDSSTPLERQIDALTLT